TVAAEQKKSTKSTSGNVVQVDAVTAKIKVPVYKPPKRGAPAARVGGGTRGVDGVLPDVYVLAPDHVGLTTHEQPTLSWYMSKPTAIHFEFSLIDENGIEPLLELTLEAGNLKAGIQGLDLAKYGIKLKPEVQYQWSVALVPDSKKRSSDVIASGMIERRGVDNSIAERLSKADAQEDVFIYAEKGYWYDAVSELSVLIDKNPGNKILRQQRAELLKQAGLPDELGK
ncbi:MAG: DUF928 domain-containing protein, partial [Gammaproteobacteria bacterium]|nr:DUF928 domain-containing protein [Gammaproteobacteria bacterium]